MLKHRQLTINDLSAALRLPEEVAERLAAPLLSDLRALTMPLPPERDPAGIPYRGGDVFRQVLEGRPISELRAAYLTLRRLNCQQVVIDSLEIVSGIEAVDETPAELELINKEGHA